MYFSKEWGHEIMGRKSNRISLGGGYTKRGKRRYLLLSLRMWVPYFSFSDLPWRFDDFKYIWIYLEEKDVGFG